MWIQSYKQYTHFFIDEKKRSLTIAILFDQISIFPGFPATSCKCQECTFRITFYQKYQFRSSNFGSMASDLILFSFFVWSFRDSWVRITNAWNWIKLPGNYRVNKRMILHRPLYYGGRHFFGSWDTRVYISTLYSVCLWFIFIGLGSYLAENIDYSYCSCLQVFLLIFIVVHCSVLGYG